MEKTVVELFAGVGGFRVGLNKIKMFEEISGLAVEDGDWNFVWANQWEPSRKVQHAYNCYTARFGVRGTSNRDITTKEAKDEIPSHSLLVGGFPCQDYSVARSKSNEMGIKGKKGVLFWDIVSILKDKNTPFFLLENVDRLLKSPAVQRGRDFGIMLKTLGELGYDLEWRVINAADYSGPQRRRRVFIFGWKNNLDYSKMYENNTTKNLEIFAKEKGLFGTSFPIENKISLDKELDLTEWQDTVKMTDKFSFLFQNTGIMVNQKVLTFKSIPVKNKEVTLKSIVDDESDLSPYYLSKEQKEKFKSIRSASKTKRTNPNGEVYYYTVGKMSEFDSLDLPGRTILTSEGSINRSTHIVKGRNNRLRFITPIEAERMQVFPTNWTDTGMPSRTRYFVMGNALVTSVISQLEPKLSSIIEKE